MYDYSFVTVRTGSRRSITNYVYINAFKDLPSVVLSHVCVGICSLIYFAWRLHLWKKKKKKKAKHTSVVLAKWYTLFCGNRESKELVLGTWVWFLLLLLFLNIYVCVCVYIHIYIYVCIYIYVLCNKHWQYPSVGKVSYVWVHSVRHLWDGSSVIWGCGKD